MKVVVCARNYPVPGGRISLLVMLLEKFPDIKVISYEQIKGRFKNVLFNLKCFRTLLKEQPDVVLGMGLANEASMIYARIFGKRGYYNISGLRFNGYNLISFNVISEIISIFFCYKVIVPSDAAKERIEKYLPLFKSKILLIPEGVKPIRSKRHVGVNIGFTRVAPQDYEKVYGQIQKQYKRFGKARLFFIKVGKIEMITNGRLTQYKTNSMKELLPILDCLFILPSSDHDYHSSSMLEALEADVPFFISDVKFLNNETKQTFSLKDSNPSTLISRYSDFTKNKKKYLAKYQRLRKKTLTRYSYIKTIESWRKLFGF